MALLSCAAETGSLRRLDFLSLTLAALLATSCREAPLIPPHELPDHAVVLVGLDGFRWDYPELYPTPNLDRLAAAGGRAGRLIPAFPSKTFPNHYTLVTGLYPGHHGVVGNTMWDEELGDFGMRLRSAVQDARWWGGEPLWVTAERRGLRTAPLFWPGSEAPIGGLWPTHWQPYDHGMSASRRVEKVLDWLAGRDGPPVSFATLYLSEVDTAGHRYGPRSEQTAAAVTQVDAVLGELLAGLAARGLDHVEVVVVADHGMAETSTERVMVLADHLDVEDLRIVGGSPVVGLWPGELGEAEILRRLRPLAPALVAYRREETPEHWYFRASSRVPPIVAVAAEGWTVLHRHRLIDRDRLAGGSHGYDPRTAPTMHAIFYAAGPSFRPGARIDSLAAVDVYSLLCELLRLPPRPHDGQDPWRGLLRR